MDTTKPLFQPIWIPRKVVIYHQMGSLEIYSFACSIRSNKHQHILVLFELLFYLTSVIPCHAAMDGDYSLSATEQRGYFFLQVIKRVFMFREDDELFPFAIGSNDILIFL